ncbi:condensation domain-containing protein [Streptomyces sp. NBC_00083]|uniref:condensation domain-containing protein n=1 Tax=Streptomyces sp. NBC_00083 TaxID=2975647 RepID=UPI00225BA2AF|nr:condensation domain-containing protein [Streptomyces sp. NBC_00083]MCX5384071.1 condensation domain-containing protein [Streptomyces sp. NBC_00083]
MHPSITGQYLARYQRLGAGDPAPGPLPVTGAQRRFLLVRALDPAGRADIVPMFFAFPRGTVDPARLRAAANHLAARHPALRSPAVVERGTPVLRPAPADVPLHQVAPAPGEDARDALRRALAGWVTEGPPLRLFLADDGPGAEEEVLAVVLDHTACDGQSLARVVEELGAAYRDGLGPHDLSPADAAAELAAYKDAVLRQLAAEDRAASPRALAYWGERLRPAHERAPLPGARRTTAGLPTGAAESKLPSPPGGMPFPALLDACRAAAATLYGTGPVSPIGYPWGGRPAGTGSVLGCFLNTVVFPADTAGTPPPEVTATQWWDDLDRADTPFDDVVRAARAGGSAWSGRLDGLLTVDDARHRTPLRLGATAGREVHVDGRQVRAPFAVSATQGPELHLRMVWDRSILDDRAAEEAFAALCAALPLGAPVH